MKNLHTYFIAAFAMLFFASCTDRTDFTSTPVKTETAVKRSGQNVDVTILLSNNTTVTLSGDEVVIGNANGTNFTVSVDGSGNHAATQVTISHDKAGLKITNGNEVYENKASAVITASGSVLYMSIDPGNISTSGTGQIVVEEMEAP